MEETRTMEGHPYHRRFIRQKVRLKVEVKALERYQTWSYNVSQDGVCFEIPRELQVGRDVLVSIYTERGKAGQPVQARCRVVWSQAGSHGHRHGGQFVMFLGDSEVRLRSFLSSMEHTSRPPPP